MFSMVEALRILFIGLAGLEIGFLMMLVYYRFQQAKYVRDARYPYGLALLTFAFALFIVGTIIGVSVRLDVGFTWPFGFFLAGLAVMMAGTVMVGAACIDKKKQIKRLEKIRSSAQ